MPLIPFTHGNPTLKSTCCYILVVMAGFIPWRLGLDNYPTVSVLTPILQPLLRHTFFFRGAEINQNYISLLSIFKEKLTNIRPMKSKKQTRAHAHKNTSAHTQGRTDISIYLINVKFSRRKRNR